MASLSEWLRANKPAASRRWHLLLAALLWSLVGVTLLTLGTWWSLSAKLSTALLPVAVCAGFIKTRFLLDRVAFRIIDRIRIRGDGQCIGGFISVRTWGLVAVMAIAGRLLRSSPLPHTILALLYAAVGTALVLASRHLWRAWHKCRLQ